MASENYSPTSDTGVSVQDTCWGRIYTGRESSLVAAGIVQSEWLPGKPGNNKTRLTVVFENGKPRIIAGKRRTPWDCDHIRIIRISEDNYDVHKRHSPAEAEIVRQREEVNKAHEQEAKAIAALPASSEAFRARVLKFVELDIDLMQRFITQQNGGYSFGPELQTAIDLVAYNIFSAVENAKVYFNRGARDKEVAEIKRKTMDIDPEFSAFMSATLATAKAASSAR